MLVIAAAVLDGLAFGYLGLVAAYLSVAVAIQMRSEGALYESSTLYGTYLGVAGGMTMALGAVAVFRRQVFRRPAVVVLVTILLVAFLLPWARYGGTYPGVMASAAVFAAALALLLPMVWSQRLLLAGAAALYTAAAFTWVPFPAVHAYGAWIGLGVAIGLFALVVVTRPSLPKRIPPSWFASATCLATAMLVTSLFLPWQTHCFPTESDIGPPFAGRCVSQNGWFYTDGSAAGLLALAFVFAPLAELAAGVGLLVATVGFSLQHGDFTGGRQEFGYGSILGFVAAALIVVLAASRVRPPNRVQLVRLVPVAACLAYIFAMTVPWWGVLPERVATFFRFALPFWFALAGTLFAIALIGLWLRGKNTGWLVIVPLVLLALVVLDVIRARGFHSGSGLAIGLCVFLAVLGYVEHRRGLRDFRIPDFFRIDRL